MSKELVKLGIDSYKGNLVGQYSKQDASKVLREALIDLNGGSTKLDYRKMRNGAGNEMFAIIEEILQNTIVEGIQDDNFFQNFVEYRNVALGDERDFYVEDPSLFIVSDTAEGTQNVRKQRLNTGTSSTIPTTLKTVKIWEHLNRVLAGRVDFNGMIDKVGESYKRKVANDIYTSFAGAFSSLPATFAVSGAYSEDQMITLIDHVESATGQKATIVGTRAALRKVTTAVVSESAKEAYNEMGYYGNFNGSPMMMIKQAHTPGTYNFMISDNDLFVVPSGVKPVKYITEGEPLMLQGDPMNNQDLSLEYFFGDRYGLGIIIATLFGIYRIA